ncbi:hypothetical protein ACFV29_41595 [Streptomyces sp. NPDC059690]|uniref:hypothetical protein n=1 Tax=Streptomyces sp. NPDC059690 TaxID=3346907 RepID=UPI0036779982
MTAVFYSPAHAARMTADALRGRSVGCPRSGTIQVVGVAADGHIWPIRIRFTARAERWPVQRIWEATFEPADVTDEEELCTGEFGDEHAQELATNALTLLLEYLATGPGGGIREIDAPQPEPAGRRPAGLGQPR